MQAWCPSEPASHPVYPNRCIDAGDVVIVSSTDTEEALELLSLDPDDVNSS
jgi:hypothetical protein